MMIDEVLHRENLQKAYKRVVKNGGAPGVDGVAVEELMDHCRAVWPMRRDS